MDAIKKWIKGFNDSACKAHLKTARCRARKRHDDIVNRRNVLERDVGLLLKDNEEAKARIKAEQILQLKNLDQALDLLQIWCELVETRIKFIKKEKLCPPDMISAIHSIVYCQGRVDVTELDDVRKQFELKYGDEWIRLGHQNKTKDVHPQLVMLLSVDPPKRWEVTQILVDVAAKKKLDWQPQADEVPNPAAVTVLPMAPAHLGVMPGVPAYGAPGVPAHGKAPAYGAPTYGVPSTGPAKCTPVPPMAVPVQQEPSYSEGGAYPSTGVRPDQPGAGSAPSAPALQPPQCSVIQYPPSKATSHPVERSHENLWSSMFGWLLRVAESLGNNRAKTDQYLRNAHFVALFFFEPGVLASDRMLPVVQDALGRLKAHQCEVIGVHTAQACSDLDFDGLLFATILSEEAHRLVVWEEYRSQGAQIGDIILLDSNGHKITTEAAKFLTQDPQLLDFPWRFGVSESRHSSDKAHNRSPQPAPAACAPENDYDDLLSRFEALKSG